MPLTSYSLRVERVQPGCTVPKGLTLAPPAGGFVVGRNPDCEVSLDDVSVSRRHLEVRPIDGGFAVRCLAQRGATFVNQQPLAADEELVVRSDAAWLQIGRLLLRMTAQPETMPVHEPMPLPAGDATPGAVAPRIVIQGAASPRVWLGGLAVPIFPSAARVLARLCETPDEYVSHDALLEAVDPDRAARAGGANLTQLVTYVRDAFAEAIAQGGLQQDDLRMLVLAADPEAADELADGADDRRTLLRALIPSRRGVGYRIRMPRNAITFI